ncbi:MAG: 23S rRNA (uracil(1939)-C(5))-methyltransferase RlmD [Elusimicrobiaceae bacterium]|nr:23S rRNA (uracil(1939)-C(5))-methyltransferase RlmD [Elusimicrobiaceae bacterium]
MSRVLPPEEQETLKVTAERFVPGGESVCETERGNKKVLVPYAATGDVLEIKTTGTNSKAMHEGTILHVLQHGHGRTEPECPLHFTPGKTFWCGGCDFGHLTYDEQLKAKFEIVEESFRRAGLANIAVRKPLASPVDKRYRNKNQIPVVHKADGRVLTGFYQPGTHRIVPFEDCIVQPKLTIEILRVLRELVSKAGWSTYDIDSGRGWLKHFFIRTNSKSEAVVVLVASSGDAPGIEQIVRKLTRAVPAVVSVYLNVQIEKTPVVLGHEWIHLHGKSLLTETLCGMEFMMYPGSFLQVNNRAAEKMFNIVGDFLAMGEKTPFLYDIYCGVGVIGLLHCNGYERLIGIEENQGAVACAYKNAENNHIENASFIAGKAETVFAADIYSKLSRTATVIVDPPRKGCNIALLTRFKHPSIRKIIYVSCNPETFARDAQVLMTCGFDLKIVQPIDMFPQTAHIELITYFERS